MRETFHMQLGTLNRDLSAMAELTAAGLRGATIALLEADPDKAHQVDLVRDAIENLHTRLDARAMQLLACQQPVACDLRTLFASLRISADLERMGCLAAHIAWIAARRSPDHAVPEEFSAPIAHMAMVAAELADAASRIITAPDVTAARAFAGKDEAIDTVHRDLLRALLAPGEHYDKQTAIDITLLGRYYERYADHAVAIARRLEFAITGVRG